MRCYLLLLLSLSTFRPASAQTASPLVGLSRLARPDRLPFLFVPGTVTKQVASVDYSGRGDDGNYARSFTQYVDATGEHVIFDEYGPGCLYRQHMNVWLESTRGTTLYPYAGRCRIRYYFDNESRPRIDQTVDELFGGQTAPFAQPLSFLDSASRFATLYYPIPFQKRLKVTVVPADNWNRRVRTKYQFTYQTYPTAEGIYSWTFGNAFGPGSELSTVRDQWQRTGQDPKDTLGNQTLNRTLTLAPGARQSILLDGAGSVASLKIRLRPYARDVFFQTYLRIYWDGQDSASVDVPLAYFFGSGNAANPTASTDALTQSLKTLLFGYDGPAHTMYSYWPMPYWTGARIEFVNRSKRAISALTCQIGYKTDAVLPYPKRQCGYFCVKRTTDAPDPAHRYVLAFAERGRGHVVGTTFFGDGSDPDGTMVVYTDDGRSSLIRGNGTADDYNQGWGGSAIQQPLWGSLRNGTSGAYRIQLTDAYVFHKTISIHYGYPGGTDRILPQTDVTVFYYQSPYADTLRLTDRFDVGDAYSERIHRYRLTGTQSRPTLSSRYESDEPATARNLLTDTGRSFGGYSEFRVDIDPNNAGVRLRKRTDRRQKSPQTADVWVDGVKVSEKKWHLVYSKSVTVQQAWGDADFEIPTQYTRGKSSLNIKIQSFDWNEFFYSVYCYPAL